MKVDIVTIFPKMVEGPLTEGIVARAIAGGVLDVKVHDLRDFTTDRHRVVDDMPFGGGPGGAGGRRAGGRAGARVGRRWATGELGGEFGGGFVIAAVGWAL